MIEIAENPAILDIPFEDIEVAWMETHLWCLAMEVV